MKSFDRKFGPDLISSLPGSPGVYLFKDGEQNVLYVGKAKDVRRRLASYRDASRRKVDRKKLNSPAQSPPAHPTWILYSQAF